MEVGLGNPSLGLISVLNTEFIPSFGLSQSGHVPDRLAVAIGPRSNLDAKSHPLGWFVLAWAQGIVVLTLH